MRVGRRRGERESLAVVWGLPAGALPQSRDTPPFPPTGDGPAVSCGPSSGGRCGDGVEALPLGCAQRHQRVPQGLCLAGHGLDGACAVWALVVIEALLDRGPPGCAQTGDQPRELVRRRRDGFGGSQAAAPPPREGPESWARVVDRARREAPGHGHAMGAGAHGARPHRASREGVRWREAQPTAAVCDAGPATHVGPALCAEDQRRAFCHALHGRPVDPRQARAGRAGITGRCVRVRRATGFRGQRLAGACLRTGAEVRLAVVSAHGALLRRPLRPCDGVLEGAEVFGTPGAWQRFGDLVRTVLAGRVAELGQGERVACASETGWHDGHPRGAGEVTHALGACAVHLVQGLVPGLQLVRAVGEEPLAVAESAAPHADLVVGAAGRSEPPRGVQAVPPWAVEPSGCRSSGGACGLTRVEQEDLQAARLQACTQGHPGDPGGCPRHRGEAAVEEPVGAGIESGGEGTEAADRLGGALWWHGHPVLGFAAIDPRRMGVGEWECAGRPEPRGLREGRDRGTRLRERIFRGGHGRLHTCKERRQERRGGRRDAATGSLPNGIRPRPVASEVVATS